MICSHILTAMDTKNFTVKRQVIQLLTALSVYSPDGHDTCLNSLQHYKVNFYLQKLISRYYHR